MDSAASGALSRTPPPGRSTCSITYSAQYGGPCTALLRKGFKMIMTSSNAISSAGELRADQSIMLLCWNCGAPLAEMTSETSTNSGVRYCGNCTKTTYLRGGIWCTLPPDRVDHFRKFIAEYEFIRAAEGRGSPQRDYYLSLPFEDVSGRNSEQWTIRAHTFRTIEQRVLRPLARLGKRPLRILDLGAGNGWMSY